MLGRCLPVEKLDENGDPVEDEDAVEQVPPLRALEEEEGDWAVSVSPAVAGGSPNSLVCVRSMRWPGACAVAFGRRFTNVYVGYGLKHAAEPYTPLPPAELQAEFNEPVRDGSPRPRPAAGVTCATVDVRRSSGSKRMCWTTLRRRARARQLRVGRRRMSRRWPRGRFVHVLGKLA